MLPDGQRGHFSRLKVELLNVPELLFHVSNVFGQLGVEAGTIPVALTKLRSRSCTQSFLARRCRRISTDDVLVNVDACGPCCRPFLRLCGTPVESRNPARVVWAS